MSLYMERKAFTVSQDDRFVTYFPQVLWTVIWIFLDNPKVTLEMPYKQTRHLQITCSAATTHGVEAPAIGTITWRIANLAVCSILALFTRKLPENYNESRYIMFCSFCSLVVFMAFSSTAFTTADAYFRAGYASLGMLVNATITLLCLYVVKIYAIYFVKLDRWNVRKPLMGIMPSAPEQTSSVNDASRRSSESHRSDDTILLGQRRNVDKNVIVNEKVI